MKVLVVAQQQQTREALARQFESRDRNYSCVGIDRLTGGGAIEQLLATSNAQLVVNIGSLEAMEQSLDEALLDGVEALARCCHSAFIPLIHISNSCVFDGIDGGRHREDDPLVPASRFGAQVLRMEERVRAGCKRHVILRTGPLFGAEGDNLLIRLLARLRAGGKVELSSAGVSCPTQVDDFSRVVSAIVDQLSCGAEVWGSYHYCCSDPASYFQFAEVVLAVTSQYLDPAHSGLELSATDAIATGDSCWPRPQLNCEKILNTFGIKQLPWRSFLAATIKQIFEEQSDE